MMISNNCIKLLKEVEGCKLKAYRDVAGILTIGYGHTERVREGDCLTPQEAIDLLYDDIKPRSNAVKNMVLVPLEQWQFDALVSFVFNIGTTAFDHSTLLKRLNQNLYDSIPNQMRRWVYADGKIVKGLVNRREKEIALWNNQLY